MDKASITLLDIFLALRVSSSGIFPEIELICWLTSVRLVGLVRAKLLVVQAIEGANRSRTRPRVFETTEFSLSDEKVEKLGELLIELGFPEREPRIRHTSSAESIWVAHLIFEVGIDGESLRLERSLGPEGIAGPDADKLRGVLGTLLERQGIRNQWAKLLFERNDPVNPRWVV